MGLAAVVLSSWLVLLMRAVYRDDGGFRAALANATPLWVPVLTGVAVLFSIKDWLVRWVETCLPADGWSGPGTFFIGLGLHHSPADPATSGDRPPKLPPERRRVIVEYALTYGVAVIVILIGVGLV